MTSSDMAAENSLPATNLQENNDKNELSGCAILIVIGEAFSDDHKDVILDRISKGIKTWDGDNSGCDINAVLGDVASQSPQAALSDSGDKGAVLLEVDGEALIESAGDEASVSVLINPQLETLHGKLRNFFKANTKYRHVIYAGHVFNGSGNWVLQDDHVSFAKFVSVFKEHEVSNALNQQKGGILSINAFKNGDWSDAHFAKQAISKTLKIRFNPDAKLEDTNGVDDFVNFMSNYVKVTPTKSLLKSSDVVGNIRFSRPTLYIFPGCQGDSALLGVSGFNLLINGGYSRKACFWDFARHLDRIDAMLLTHLGEDNLFGVSSVLQRKTEDNVHPEIGYILFNGVEKQKHSPNGDLGAENGGLHKEASLHIDLIEEGDKMMENMRALNQTPHPCVGKMQGASLQPMNLYHKVGHGSLDMYVLNPQQDSKELKEFMSQWSKHGSSFSSKGGVPLPNMLSVCSLLVWRPASPDEKITRILFPAGVPQSKLFEGLDKMKNMNIFQHATCTEHSLKTPASKAKKTLVAKVAPIQKSSPGGSPRSTTPRGSVRSIHDKVKPAPAKTVGTKPAAKTTREATKKAPVAKATPTKEKKPVAVDKKGKNEKLEAPTRKTEAISPTMSSSSTQDSENAISDASTTDIAQMAAAVKEELSNRDDDVTSSSQQSPMTDAPVDLADVEPTMDESPQQKEVQAPVEEPMLESPQRDTEHVGELPLDENKEAAAAHREFPAEPIVQLAAELTDSEPLVELDFAAEEGAEIQQSPATDEVKQEQEDEEVKLQEDEPSSAKELESPEPLPDPQRFTDPGFGGDDDMVHGKSVEDDEKDVDTSEAQRAISPELASKIEMRQEVESDQEEEQAPQDFATSPQIETAPSPVEDVPIKEEQYQADEKQTDHAFNGVEDYFGHQAQHDVSPGDDPASGGDFQSGQDRFVDEPLSHGDEASHSESLSEASNQQPDLLMSHDQHEQDLRTPESPRAEAEGQSMYSEGQTVDHEDIDVRQIREHDQPFDGAQPEGLPSPREVPEIIPDEVMDTPDIMEHAQKEQPTMRDEFQAGHDEEVEETDSLGGSESEFKGEVEGEEERREERTPDKFPQEGADFLDEFEAKEQQQDFEVPEVRDQDKAQDDEIPRQSETPEPEETATGPTFCDDSLNFGQDADSSDVIRSPQERHEVYQREEISSPDLDAKIEDSPGLDNLALTEEDNGSSIDPEAEQNVEDINYLDSQPEDHHQYHHDKAEPDAKSAHDDNLQSWRPDLVSFENDPHSDRKHEADLIPPPECDLYSANAFDGNVPQEPLEPQQPREYESNMFDDQSLLHDPLQNWQTQNSSTSEQSQNPFYGLPSSKEDSMIMGFGHQQDTDIPFDNRDNGEEPQALENHSANKAQDEFDPVKEWGLPMGLPAPSPANTAAEKKPGVKGEPKKTTPGAQTKSTATKKPSSATAKTNTSRLNTSTIGTKKAATTDSNKENSTTRKPTSSATRMNTTRKAASATERSPASKENGAKTDTKKSSILNKSTLKKEPGTGAKRPAVPKAPVAKSLETSRLSAKTERLNTTAKSGAHDTSRLDTSRAAAKSSVGTKRPATAPGGKAAPAPKLHAVTPFYVDLAYIPHHGDSNYMNLDYFRRVRARYYVYSALQPDTNILDLLLDAKKTWGEEAGAEVTVIPTYDNEALRSWMRANNDKLAEFKVEIAPSASRCTIQLQDHETSCAAYRLEF